MKRFVAASSDKESHLKKESIGLVNLDEFQRIREAIEAGDPTTARPSNNPANCTKGKKRRNKASGVVRNTLSFGDEEEAFDDGEQGKIRRTMLLVWSSLRCCCYYGVRLDAAVIMEFN